MLRLPSKSCLNTRKTRLYPRVLHLDDFTCGLSKVVRVLTDHRSFEGSSTGNLERHLGPMEVDDEVNFLDA